jgi:hypothetical protein
VGLTFAVEAHGPVAPWGAADAVVVERLGLASPRAPRHVCLTNAIVINKDPLGPKQVSQYSYAVPLTASMTACLPVVIVLALVAFGCTSRVPAGDPLAHCPAGPASALCRGSPVDLQSDSANCGSCGNACPTGGTCGLGVCWVPGDAAQCAASSRPGAGTWTELGPPLSGRIDAIAPSAMDPNAVLIGSPGGGLWRTRSGGSAWTHLGVGALADETVLHLERDRADPARLYALTATDLYASTDAGDTWKNLTGSGGHPRPISAARNADPFAFAQLLASGGGHLLLWSFRSSGFYYSTDSGQTVHQLVPFSGPRSGS